MTETILVTGANGHLGNNLVRALCAQGKAVRAGIRQMTNQMVLDGLACEIVPFDMLDRASIEAALEGVTTVIHAAAVFKHWAKHPVRDIIQPNLDGTRNVLELAAQKGVRKVIYVSSIAALDYAQVPMHEGTWNTITSDPYIHAKMLAEKLAWELAESLQVPMVAVLPSAIIGPHCFGHLTPTMGFLAHVLSNNARFDVNFTMNYVHVDDVVAGILAALTKGKTGRRYILGNESPVPSARVFELAQSLLPHIQKPPLIDKASLLQMAKALEAASRENGQEPLLTTYGVELYYSADPRLDISLARCELDFSPRDPETAIRQTLQYLVQRFAPGT